MIVEQSWTPITTKSAHGVACITPKRLCHPARAGFFFWAEYQKIFLFFPFLLSLHPLGKSANRHFWMIFQDSNVFQISKPFAGLIQLFEMYSASHLGWHFRMLFQSSQLKARTSLLPRFSRKRRSSFELRALKAFSKMWPHVGLALHLTSQVYADQSLARGSTRNRPKFATLILSKTWFDG